jgi:ATP-dependent DNA helicase RecQ
LIRAGQAAGRFDDDLVRGCADLVGRWDPGPAPVWVAGVPSRRTGDLVPGFARRLAAALGLEYVDALDRVGNGPPQAEMRNSAQQVANVRGQFRVVAPPPAGAPGLLVDDLRLSGWTLATVGAQLRMAGAGPVYPLVLSLAGA